LGSRGPHLPALATPPTFVRGVAESLPFEAASFDAVLMFWSLNHVADAERAVQEAARILRPGGAALLVLEDMQPRWSDIVERGFWSHGRRRALKTISQMIGHAVSGRPWPLQSDHIRVGPDDLAKWGAPNLAITERVWIGQYLTYNLVRNAS